MISIVGALFHLIFWLLVIAMIWFFFSKVLPKIKEYRQIWFERFPRFNQALVVLTILIAVMVVAFNVWFWMMTNSFFEAFIGIFKGLLDTLFLFVLSAFFIPLVGGYYLQRKELKNLSQQPVYEEPEPVMERHTGDEDEKEQPQTLKVEPDPQAFDHLIDMEPAINVLKESLEFPIHHPELMEKYRIKPPAGLLLYGPPGTGKTALARAASKYFGCSFFPVKAGELLSSAVGSSEEKLREVFDQAKSNRPSIIFFDEIDSIATKRDGSNMNRPSDVLLTPLLTELDGFDGREGVFVMAATNRLDVLDEAVLRPGRFDRHIKVDLPGLEGRKKLIRHFLFGRPVKDVDVDHWAQVFERKSPAWMEGIIDQAVIEAAKREGQGFKATGITNEDIRKACPDLVDNFVKKESNPQAFDHLIGMERPIEVLKEALEFPIKHPELMDKFKIKPPAGLLLCRIWREERSSFVTFLKDVQWIGWISIIWQRSLKGGVRPGFRELSIKQSWMWPRKRDEEESRLSLPTKISRELSVCKIRQKDKKMVLCQMFPLGESIFYL